MRVAPKDLSRHLEGGLAPIYLISGDEPLQLGECLDAVRAAARGAGFSDRVLMDADARFDWDVLRHYADSLSLFAERRILELRLAGAGVPGDTRAREAGTRVLSEYAANPSPDNLLLVSCARLDKRAQATRWFKALDGAGVTIQVWPVEAPALPAWVRARASRLGLALDEEAAAALAERVEGNLLSCAQELEKLRLLYGEGRVEVEAVLAAVTDSARFDPFDLVDSMLAGKAVRTARILRGLRDEGVDPLPVLGALAWALRALATLAREAPGGHGLDGVLRKPAHRAWVKRRAAIGDALRRHSAAAWLGFIEQAALVDRVAKDRPGDPWAALQALALAVCGVALPGSYNGRHSG